MKGLYIITPDWDDTGKLLAVTEQALRGGAAIVQYRHKTASPALRLEQATALLALCRRYQRPLIINDHVDLLLALDADGVHVGESDASVALIRAQVGADKIVGASCYGDMARVRTACAAGASYIAFGGFYPSRVKKYPVTTALDIVQQMKREMPDLPCCAIGGMTPDNARPLVERGVDVICAISSVYFADSPEEAAQNFVRLFEDGPAR